MKLVITGSAHLQNSIPTQHSAMACSAEYTSKREVRCARRKFLDQSLHPHSIIGIVHSILTVITNPNRCTIIPTYRTLESSSPSKCVWSAAVIGLACRLPTTVPAPPTGSPNSSDLTAARPGGSPSLEAQVLFIAPESFPPPNIELPHYQTAGSRNLVGASSALPLTPDCGSCNVTLTSLHQSCTHGLPAQKNANTTSGHSTTTSQLCQTGQPQHTSLFTLTHTPGWCLACLVCRWTDSVLWFVSPSRACEFCPNL